MTSVNVGVVVLFAITTIVVFLFWNELMRVISGNKKSKTKGPVRGFVRSVHDHEQMPEAGTEEDVKARFEADRKKSKGSLIRDMANSSPWKDAPPSAEFARDLAGDIDEVTVAHVGKRTVPSKEIEKVDRSDRRGEDAGLTDRVSANAAVQNVPDALKDVVADAYIAERQAKRDKLMGAMQDLDDLLDD